MNGMGLRHLSSGYGVSATERDERGRGEVARDLPIYLSFHLSFHLIFTLF